MTSVATVKGIFFVVEKQDVRVVKKEKHNDFYFWLETPVWGHDKCPSRGTPELHRMNSPGRCPAQSEVAFPNQIKSVSD